MKRLFDIVFSGICMTLIIPLIPILAGLVAINLGRPIFYIQTRPGLRGKLFTLRKFRSMTDDKDIDGSLLADDARLNSFGRWLRSTSLDELPELWNIFVGDMSFVGPRPLLTEYLPLYNEEQVRRHEVRPGLTGWAQINGRNALDWQRRFELDVWYVDNQSLILDIKILAMTLSKLIRREGISADGHVTMKEFTGND